GGKDSWALLNILVDRQKRVPIDYKVEAVHLDMGYEDPREAAVLQDQVAALGVSCHLESTNYGRIAHSEVNRENPCFLCARLRRRRLFELAKDLGCSKVALGHHRDDLTETLLLNIFYSGEISTMMPVQEFFGGLLTIIRPLCMVPEDKIKKALNGGKWPRVVNACPSGAQSKRREVKELIAGLSRDNRKVKGNIFHALSNWRADYLLPRTAPKPAPAAGQGPKKNKKLFSSLLDSKEGPEMTEDLRRRKRVHYKTAVTLTTPDKILENLSSRDLSLKGVYVETKDMLPIGTEVEIVVDLAGSSSLLSLRMVGRVARLDADGMGLDFLEVDLDSFFHLRNIVLYNADDPAEVDDELVTRPAFIDLEK
ncbi:MAG: PilZ domain-containing protein, partial [Deltaproteobacteria bacterium]|nr:PilZ domain-containing protein [Deltaproteobacteria bacterium]